MKMRTLDSHVSHLFLKPGQMDWFDNYHHSIYDVIFRFEQNDNEI